MESITNKCISKSARHYLEPPTSRSPTSSRATIHRSSWPRASARSSTPRPTTPAQAITRCARTARGRADASPAPWRSWMDAVLLSGIHPGNPTAGERAQSARSRDKEVPALPRRKAGARKEGPVRMLSRVEATLQAKPRFNGFACGHGAHGDVKYNRAKRTRLVSGRDGGHVTEDALLLHSKTKQQCLRFHALAPHKAI